MHNTIISWHIAMQCILQYIVIFHMAHWKCENGAETEVAVYDLGRLNTSHYILIIQRIN